VHPKRGTTEVSRTRPLRVLSRRPGEFLCQQAEDAEPEWVDVEMVDDEVRQTYVQPPRNEAGPQIIESVETWIASGDLWEEEF